MTAARIHRAIKAALLPGRSASIHLDGPHVTPGQPCGAASPLHVHGWVMPPAGVAVRSLDILVDGERVAQTSGNGQLPPILPTLPGRVPRYRNSFSTEVPLDRWVGRTAEMTLVGDFGAESRELARIPLKVETRREDTPRRERSFRLDDLLACPDCGESDLDLAPDEIRCRVCGVSYRAMRGTPMFAPPGVPVASRLLATHHTHPYSDDSLALIEGSRSGVVLDFGAGHPHPDRLYPHVLLHEAVHYQPIDIVCLTPRLPYRDNAFDAIISQAVFEHVPRPWEMAQELHRVLKPGGQIHIDTAFMQPFHSDPYHYFNMTIPGLREVFRPFREVRVGVKPYQLPSFGLRMQLDVMLTHLGEGAWRTRMQGLRDELDRDGDGLDAALDAAGRRYLAAGVYFHGVKE